MATISHVAAVATGFPSGQYPLNVKLDDTRYAVDEGADEIDMVISRGHFLSGDYNYVFDEIAPQFTDRYHVIGLTRRGFGETERPAAGYDTIVRVEDIRAFMDAMKITRAHLVGHSLAGDEMTQFASSYPQRVIKLVYLDAAYDRRKFFSCTNDQPGGLPASYRRIVGEAMNCPGWEKTVATDMPSPELVNVQVSTMRSAMMALCAALDVSSKFSSSVRAMADSGCDSLEPSR